MNVEGDTRVQKYFRNILPYIADFPDVLRTVADGGFATSDKAYDQERQCTKCGSPWVLGAYKARLLKWPSRKTKLVRILLRKQQKCRVRLKNSEKLLLSLYRSKQNTLQITCLACRNKMKAYCSIPKGLRKSIKKAPKIPVENVDQIPVENVTVAKKKKKKKKELNAGLLLPSSTNEKAIEKDNSSTSTQKPLTKDHKEKGSSKLNTCNNTFKDHISQRLSSSMPIKKVSDMKVKKLKYNEVKDSTKIKSALENLKSKKESTKTSKETNLSSFLSSLV